MTDGIIILREIERSLDKQLLIIKKFKNEMDPYEFKAAVDKCVAERRE